MPETTTPDFAAIAAGLNQQQVPATPTYSPMGVPSAPDGGWGPLGILGGVAGTGLAAKYGGPRVMAAGRGLAGMAARVAPTFYTPGTAAVPGAAFSNLVPNVVGSQALGTFTPATMPWATSGAGIAGETAGTAATTGGLTTAGMVAAPVAGLAAGAAAWQGINGMDIGGEGSTWDRGLSGGAGGVLGGAGIGATIGSVIPGVGTAVGAGVGAVAGGVSAALANIKWGDKDTKFKEMIDTASGQIDTTFNNLVKINNVDPAIAEQAALDTADIIEKIHSSDAGFDEKMAMFEELQIGLEKTLVKYKGTAPDPVAIQNEQIGMQQQQDLQAFAQGIQNQEETKRALAVQAFIAQQMKPYADQMAAGGDNAGALAAMQSAQAMPAIMGMQAQSQRLENFRSERQLAVDETMAQAQLLSSYAQMANAQKSALGGGNSGNPLDALAK